MTPAISLVIPAFNEEQRLPAFLESLRDYSQGNPRILEVIVIDDGSRDGTAQAAQAFSGRLPGLKTIRLKANRGKGYAVRRGVFASQGDIVIFMDADGATPPSEIDEACAVLAQGYDVVIGSRVLSDERHTVTARPIRIWLGRIFNVMVRTFLKTRVYDSQCGFKAFTRQAARRIFPRVMIDRYGFDMEIIHLVGKQELLIKEIPVNWEHKKGSKINFLTDATRMLINIFQIRWWHRYSLPVLPPEHMSAEQIKIMLDVEQKHWWFQSKKRAVEELIRRIAPAPAEILDVGCGTGMIMQAEAAFGKVSGSDISSTAIGFCRDRGLPWAIQCPVDALTFADRSFDLVSCLDVIEHAEDDHRAMRELGRVLVPGGRLLVMVPAFPFLMSAHDAALSHLRRYSPRSLRNLCEESGFQIESMGFLFGMIFPAVAAVRIIRRFLPVPRQFTCDTEQLPPPWVNRLLIKMCQWEAGRLRYGNIPYGTTLYVMAINCPEPARP
jgi:dolichyl-phosphate beta-glucosyltransferase